MGLKFKLNRSINKKKFQNWTPKKTRWTQSREVIARGRIWLAGQFRPANQKPPQSITSWYWVPCSSEHRAEATVTRYNQECFIAIFISGGTWATTVALHGLRWLQNARYHQKCCKSVFKYMEISGGIWHELQPSRSTACIGRSRCLGRFLEFLFKSYKFQHDICSNIFIIIIYYYSTTNPLLSISGKVVLLLKPARHGPTRSWFIITSASRPTILRNFFYHGNYLW